MPHDEWEKGVPLYFWNLIFKWCRVCNQSLWGSFFYGSFFYKVYLLVLPNYAHISLSVRVIESTKDKEFSFSLYPLMTLPTLSVMSSLVKGPFIRFLGANWLCNHLSIKNLHVFPLPSVQMGFCSHILHPKTRFFQMLLWCGFATVSWLSSLLWEPGDFYKLSRLASWA